MVVRVRVRNGDLPVLRKLLVLIPVLLQVLANGVVLPATTALSPVLRELLVLQVLASGVVLPATTELLVLDLPVLLRKVLPDSG